MKFKDLIVENTMTEGYKKFKSSLDLGSTKKGSYYLVSVGYDSNGNWSYMVAKGANKPKKIQHQGDWKGKVTKTDTDVSLKLATQIVSYYEDFINEAAN